MKQRPRRRDHIIAIDGEGISDPDGKHRYTLLAGSHGGSVEAHSLTTEQCFDFLLALPPQSLVVGFSIGYDINLWLRDLIANRAALERLVEVGRCYWKSPDGKEYWIRWLPGKKFTISTGKRRRRVEKRNGTIRHEHSFERTITVWDVFGFFQTSFVKTLEQWNIGTAAQRKRIATMKGLRGDFSDDQAQQIREYCFEECELLTEIVHKLLACCDSVGVSLRGYHGAGALASAFLNKYGVTRYLGAVPPELFDAALAAYYGGRFDNSLIGKVGRAYTYDINSAYPYQETRLPCLAHGSWQAATKVSMRPGVFRVQWKMRSNAPLPFWGPFPHRSKGRITYPVCGQGWYWSEEITAAAEYWSRYGELEVSGGYEWHQDCSHQPFGWIPEVFAERRRRKAAGDFAEKILKLGPNAVYGKLAQSVGQKDQPPEYQSYVWAGLITSQTRALILRALAAGGDDVLAIATDGLISRAPLDLECGDGLGQWESAVVGNVLLLQNGVYRYRKDGKTVRRNRGFSAAEVRFTDLWKEYQAHGVKAQWQTTANRFMGLRLSLKRLDFDIWNTWVDVPKLVSLSPPSRRLPATLLNELVTVPLDTDRTYAALGDGSLSYPYVPKTDWRGLQTDGAVLAATEMQDQPEYLFG